MFKVHPKHIKYVQILNVNGNHWIMVSNIDSCSNIRNRVLVFDRLVQENWY